MIQSLTAIKKEEEVNSKIAKEVLSSKPTQRSEQYAKKNKENNKLNTNNNIDRCNLKKEEGTLEVQIDNKDNYNPYVKQEIQNIKVDIIDKRINKNQDKKNSRRKRRIWKTSYHKQFIQFWQTLFNRRIFSFGSYALQVGDAIIFGLVMGFVIFYHFRLTGTKQSGWFCDLMMTLCVIFGCRNGILSFIFGLSLERAMLWHQFMAWITLIISISHWIHCLDLWKYHGYLLQSTLIAFIFFSLRPFRRKYWEFFMRIHWILIIVTIPASILHKSRFLTYSIVYFFFDVILRLIKVVKNRSSSKFITLEKVGSNITKISMPKNKINYQGGQYFFVMIPEISYFQWHPFSVYSSSYEKDIVIFVKVLGDWTTMLYRISGEPGEPEQFPGYIDGPYGLHSISLDGDKYQNFLCVSGGIGVTPIISTAKELLFQMEQGRPISSLQFIWTGRDSCIVNSIFKPDELKQALNTNDHKILQEYYHLSNNNQSMQQLEQDQNSNKSNDIEKGTATSLSSQRKRNRIQFSKFFKYAFDQAKKNKNSLVGVLTCGPQQLINTCELYAQVFSKDGIRFDVHQEVFDF